MSLVLLLWPSVVYSCTIGATFIELTKKLRAHTNLWQYRSIRWLLPICPNSCVDLLVVPSSIIAVLPIGGLYASLRSWRAVKATSPFPAELTRRSAGAASGLGPQT